MPCSIAHYPNIGTTHCYTAAGTFKSSNAPDIIITGFARGCINCTGFNSYRLPFLISINSWLVQSVEFVKKSWNLPSNIDISYGKTVFFLSQLPQVPYKWIFLVCQILYNLARMFAAHYKSSWKKKTLFLLFLRSLLITYLITLSLEKEIIVLEKKVWEKSWILDPKTCTNPINRTNS